MDVTHASRAHRAYLVDLAFRIVGNVGTAEDMVQEAFIRLARADSVADERGWLIVVTSRLCLDHLRSAHARREVAVDVEQVSTASPVGWASPPDPSDRITLDDEVQLALAVVLRRLNPDERVAFVLHDVFQVPFASIAETLGRPVPTTRQLAKRARHKLADQSPHITHIAEDEHRLVVERFLTATGNGDLDGLLAVLHPQAWGVADLGHDAAGRQQVTYGSHAIATAMLRFYRHATLVAHPVGGRPTVLAYRDRSLFATLSLTIEDGTIRTIEANVNLV